MRTRSGRDHGPVLATEDLTEQVTEEETNTVERAVEEIGDDDTRTANEVPTCRTARESHERLLSSFFKAVVFVAIGIPLAMFLFFWIPRLVWWTASPQPIHRDLAVMMPFDLGWTAAVEKEAAAVASAARTKGLNVFGCVEELREKIGSFATIHRVRMGEAKERGLVLTSFPSYATVNYKITGRSYSVNGTLQAYAAQSPFLGFAGIIYPWVSWLVPSSAQPKPLHLSLNSSLCQESNAHAALALAVLESPDLQSPLDFMPFRVEVQAARPHRWSQENLFDSLLDSLIRLCHPIPPSNPESPSLNFVDESASSSASSGDERALEEGRRDKEELFPRASVIPACFQFSELATGPRVVGVLCISHGARLLLLLVIAVVVGLFYVACDEVIFLRPLCQTECAACCPCGKCHADFGMRPLREREKVVISFYSELGRFLNHFIDDADADAEGAAEGVEGVTEPNVEASPTTVDRTSRLFIVSMTRIPALCWVWSWMLGFTASGDYDGIPAVLIILSLFQAWRTMLNVLETWGMPLLPFYQTMHFNAALSCVVALAHAAAVSFQYPGMMPITSYVAWILVSFVLHWFAPRIKVAFLAKKYSLLGAYLLFATLSSLVVWRLTFDASPKTQSFKPLNYVIGAVLTVFMGPLTSSRLPTLLKHVVNSALDSIPSLKGVGPRF